MSGEGVLSGGEARRSIRGKTNPPWVKGGMAKEKRIAKTTPEDGSELEGERPMATLVGPAGDDETLQRKAKRFDALLASVESKLEGDEGKASMGHLVCLLQLRKEIEDERPREIEVKWVEPSEVDDAPA